MIKLKLDTLDGVEPHQKVANLVQDTGWFLLRFWTIRKHRGRLDLVVGNGGLDSPPQAQALDRDEAEFGFKFPRHHLRPLMVVGGVQDATPAGIQARAWEGLARLLPLRPHEALFVEALWERGEIRPDLLSPSPEIQARIAAMPLLLWKAQNVRRHRRL